MVIVTGDADIHDMSNVWRASAARCLPTQDVIIPLAAGGQLDPSAPTAFSSSLIGIDATRPYSKPFPEVIHIPPRSRARLNLRRAYIANHEVATLR